MMLKRIFKIFLVILVVVWACLQIANYVVVAKLPALIQKWVPEGVGASVGKVSKTGGLFGLGIALKGIDIAIPDIEAVRVEAISFEVPIWWPIRCHIQVASSPVLVADMILSRSNWQVRELNGHFFDFSFDVKGDINRLEQTGELSVRTKGLKSFVQQFKDVPSWLNMILTDGEQQFTLTPQDGALSFYGIPLIQL